MSRSVDAASWLADLRIAPEVARLRPDFRVTVVVAEGLTVRSAGTPELAAAEAEVRAEGEDVLGHPHLEQWREAYRAFGAKPQRTRPSVEALLRRAGDGLPRIDDLTDLYNAVSVRHVLPIGGEDLDRYDGPARLVRATGDERFDTTVHGEDAVEHPTPGEVVWRDDLGVTCRRWNWRQGTRTRITAATTRAMFIVEALGALGDEGLGAAVGELVALLRVRQPGVVVRERTLAAGGDDG